MTATEARALLARFPAGEQRTRAEALAPFIVYGPDYERVTTTNLVCATRPVFAEYWLDRAEQAHQARADRRSEARR